MFVYRKTVPDHENGGSKNVYFKEGFDSDLYNQAKGNNCEKFKFPLLRLAIEKKYENESLINTYRKAIEKHNENIMNATYPDSGFDLYFSQDDIIVPDRISNLLNMNIRCEMIDWNHNCSFFPIIKDDLNNHHKKENRPNSIPCYIYARSSISKTPLRMSNSIGLIDAGYRGEIMASCDNIKDFDCHVKAGERLFQLVAPDASPITYVISDSLSETTRGTGGFGSTGK